MDSLMLVRKGLYGFAKHCHRISFSDNTLFFIFCARADEHRDENIFGCILHKNTAMKTNCNAHPPKKRSSPSCCILLLHAAGHDAAAAKILRKRTLMHVYSCASLIATKLAMISCFDATLLIILRDTQKSHLFSFRSNLRLRTCHDTIKRVKM